MRQVKTKNLNTTKKITVIIGYLSFRHHIKMEYWMEKLNMELN